MPDQTEKPISAVRASHKRLVICCDGTWNRPDKESVTNIEKIARSIETDLAATDGVQQLVLYLSGVGSSYLMDRLLGGAFGFGLFNNVRSAYRFLALNYEEGDEIFVLGFSRGAYTARSVVGMIRVVGLLTRQALVDNKLIDAVDLYRTRDNNDPHHAFRNQHCHGNVRISFLGVFDTVGALGIPGALFNRHQFHDVALSSIVDCARQALSIDDRRLKFEPALWTPDPDGIATDVVQVWFEGAHSDVGGGVKETGLPDVTLLWMARQAHRQGLVFHASFLAEYVLSGGQIRRHNHLTVAYRLLNTISLTWRPVRAALVKVKIAKKERTRRTFSGMHRVLLPGDAVNVRIAETVARRYQAGEYTPKNEQKYAHATDNFRDCVEPTPAVSDPEAREILEQLSRPYALSETSRAATS